ncbi:MAG: DUF998 domain-containing protein [Anaerolineales bacterium]|nr:DUF998 domain-containing protein [Anaerolineales bacterium]
MAGLDWGRPDLSLGSLSAGLAYRGRLGEPYSPLNHFVSELGELGVSELAWAFNMGLFVGGLCLIFFLVHLGRLIGGWLGVLFGVAGLACGISGAMVGIFPMNNLAPHIFWAMNFFNLGLGLMVLFSLIVLFGRRTLPRWLAAPGLLGVAAFAAFLFTPAPAMDEMDTLAAAHAMMTTERPEVWQMAVFEWAAVGSVLIWAALVAGVLLAQTKRSNPDVG